MAGTEKVTVPGKKVPDKKKTPGKKTVPSQKTVIGQKTASSRKLPDEHRVGPKWEPVGLLLDEAEAYEVLERYVPKNITTVRDILIKTKQGLLQTSGGHAGLLISLAKSLEHVPELNRLIKRRKPLD
ncbi:hypothetical protein BDV12DRAFT_194122 [Aspergillus spectabilis]